MPSSSVGLAALLVDHDAVCACIGWRRSPHPFRTGILEALRFLCTLVAVVPCSGNPSGAPPSSPNSAARDRRPRATAGLDDHRRRADDQLQPRQRAVGRTEWLDAILDDDGKPLEEDGANTVHLSRFGTPPDDPAVRAVAGTDINAALEKTLETDPDLRPSS